MFPGCGAEDGVCERVRDGIGIAIARRARAGVDWSAP